eukprot:gene5244-3749_t
MSRASIGSDGGGGGSIDWSRPQASPMRRKIEKAISKASVKVVNTFIEDTKLKDVDPVPEHIKNFEENYVFDPSARSHKALILDEADDRVKAVEHEGQYQYYVREHETIGQAPFRSDILILPEEASKYLRSRTANTDQVSTEGGVTHAGYVTVAFLNQYYGISTNNGSSSYAQSVFETSTEYFAPTDLTLFQQHFQLHVQAAVSIGNHNTTSCPVSATNTKSCFEGNLDIQYIMGVSQ